MRIRNQPIAPPARTHQSIEDALVGLLGKPIAESSALCIPTAMCAHPAVGLGAGP